MQLPKRWLSRVFFIVGIAALLLPGTPVSARRGQSSTISAQGNPAHSTKKRSRKHRRVRRLRGQKAPTRERIKEIQAALAREGVYAGTPTSKWDAASVEAMKRFQTAHGLSPTGKMDALSLQKLGLGSEVAGRAAPRPPTQPQPVATDRP
jgi:peptidoglycan hydrolase-like protein with peptidoglycan-binding domain